MARRFSIRFKAAIFISLSIPLIKVTSRAGQYSETFFQELPRGVSSLFSRYDDFSIGNESTNYLLSVGARTHDSTASLTDNTPFTTFDADNDSVENLNCAFKSADYKNGGFWYTNCGGFQPNGEYHNGVGGQYQKFIYWKNFRGETEALRRTLMMFRKKR